MENNDEDKDHDDDDDEDDEEEDAEQDKCWLMPLYQNWLLAARGGWKQLLNKPHKAESHCGNFSTNYRPDGISPAKAASFESNRVWMQDASGKELQAAACRPRSSIRPHEPE